MFNVIAPYYDQLKNHRDYAEEARQLNAVIHAGSMTARNVLELGCGTGSLLQQFEQLGYDVAGVDESEGMLAVAQSKLSPAAELIVGDFTNLANTGRFDAVLWIDGAIGYVPPHEIAKTVASVSRLLSNEGVLIIEPWYTPESWQAHKNHHVVYEDSEHTLIRLSHGNPDGSIDFHHLFADSTGVTHFNAITKFWLHNYTEVGLRLADEGFKISTLEPSPHFKRGLLKATLPDLDHGRLA